MKLGNLIILFLIVVLMLMCVLSGMTVSLKQRVEVLEAQQEEIDYTNKQFDQAYEKYMKAELALLEKLAGGE